MAQDRQETGFYIHGNRTSLYLQKELEIRIDAVVAKYSGLFKSRNHFINCAIVRELRRLESSKPGMDTNE